MNDLTLSSGSPFDSIRRVRPDGSEYWTGRDLMTAMRYANWREFAEVIEKAKTSLAIVQSAEQAKYHLAKSPSDGGRWGNQQIDDYELTRFGAYLTAMAGDDTKRAVAEARIYFAVRTREAEVAPSLPDISTSAGLLVMAEQFTATARRLVAAEARVEAVTGGTGHTPSDWREMFLLTPEREFFDHLYTHGYLIDQRGTRSYTKNGKKVYKSGPDHKKPRSPLGDIYFKLVPTGAYGDKDRSQTVVRPTMSTALRDRLVTEGLVACPPGILSIEGGASA